MPTCGWWRLSLSLSVTTRLVFVGNCTPGLVELCAYGTGAMACPAWRRVVARSLAEVQRDSMAVQEACQLDAHTHSIHPAIGKRLGSLSSSADHA